MIETTTKKLCTINTMEVDNTDELSNTENSYKTEPARKTVFSHGALIDSREKSTRWDTK